MKKSRHRFLFPLFLFLALPLYLSGCGRTEEDIAAEEVSSLQQEIPVDFPFYESENFTLTLVSPGDAAGEYALMLYGEDGQILQRIPCGRLTEPLTFSYDGLVYGSWRDLEIFSADSDTGLFFRWKEERFSEEPIRIPRYAEVRGCDMLTVSEDEKNQEKHIYQLNEFRGQVEELRSWSLNRDSAEGEDQDSIIEYTKNGKPDYYLHQGLMEDCGVEYMGNLVEIDFIYREDDTLFAQNYHHDARTYTSTLCSLNSYFDTKERLVYGTGYLTHGSCEFYYFNEGDGEMPAYGLFLDYNGGYVIPEMVRFW